MVNIPGLGGPSNTALRSNVPLWILHLVQALVAIVVLGITASNAADFNNLGCNTPSKLGYNIAVAVISLVILAYLIPATGPKHLAAIPWHQFISLGLNAFLLILWIAAVGASVYNCSDLCNACKKADIGCGLEVWIGGDYCTCLWDYDNPGLCAFDRRSILEKASAGIELKARAASLGRAGVASSKVAAKQGFDSIGMILFLASTIYTAFLIFQHHKSSSNSGPIPPAAPQGQHQEHQQQPMQQAPGGPNMATGPDDKPHFNGGAPNGQYGGTAPAATEPTYGQQYGAGPAPGQYSGGEGHGGHVPQQL